MPPIFGKPATPAKSTRPQPVATTGVPPTFSPDLWRSTRITVYTKHSTTGFEDARKIDAKVFGSIAIAKSITFPDVWCIYCPTVGLRAFECGKDEQTALQIGYTLQSTCPMVWRCQTKEEILERMPQWIMPWLKACNEAQRWVDPTPHQEATYGSS